MNLVCQKSGDLYSLPFLFACPKRNGKRKRAALEKMPQPMLALLVAQKQFQVWINPGSRSLVPRFVPMTCRSHGLEYSPKGQARIFSKGGEYDAALRKTRFKRNSYDLR